MNKRGNIVFFVVVSEMYLTWMCMYSYRLRGAQRYTFLILLVMNQAPGVEIVLLRRHLTVMRSAALVLIFPG